MNPYQMPVTCAVCGEEGMAWAGRGHPWIDKFVHSNPAVCRDNLRREREKLEAEKKAKDNVETKSFVNKEKKDV